ncbi:MAG TPA: YdcF family protein, partial [Lysobacter sp.]
MGWLLSPLAWLLLSGLLMPWAWLRRRRVLLAVCGLVAALALAAMTALGANLLAWPLERPFLHADGCAEAMPEAPEIAIVLGGGLDGWPHSADDYAVLNLASRRRVDRAVVWWQERPGRTLVLQGGAPYPGTPALAELMASYARMQGVPPTALRLETGSGDTWENAAHAAALVPALPRRVVLVTSFVHMRRAKEAFEKNGF